MARRTSADQEVYSRGSRLCSLALSAALVPPSHLVRETESSVWLPLWASVPASATSPPCSLRPPSWSPAGHTRRRPGSPSGRAARRAPLTGALARDGWTNRARRILDRYGDASLVCFADIDYFRDINSAFGHAAGDAVLTTTAARMREWAGPRGAVGRLDGDELVIAIRIAPGRRRVRLQQLVDALAESVTADGTRIKVAVSVGAAAPDQVGTRELKALLRCADIALMQRAKHTGTSALAHRGEPRRMSPMSLSGHR